MITGIADDISGAAETAAALGQPARVVLGAPTAPADPTAEVVADAYAVTVYDLDVRYADQQTAEARLRNALTAGSGSPLFVKIDSLLRGNLGTTLRATYATGRPAVLAPSLPAAGRTVVDGVPLVDGRPLADTDLWHAESAPPPRHLDQFLQAIPHRRIPLEQVRRGGVADAVAAARAAGELVVADAATAEDLDVIARAAWGPQGDPATVLVGTRGLAEAAGALTGPAYGSGVETPDLLPQGGAVLVIVGSAHPVAHDQFDRLVADPAVRSISLSPDEVLRTRRIPLAAEAGVTTVRITPDDGVDPGRSRELAGALTRAAAEAVADLATNVTTVVIIGGETARAFLDHLRVDQLRIVATEPDGVVHSLAVPPGRPAFHLVTRPGSFGAADNLAALVHRLTNRIS